VASNILGEPRDAQARFAATVPVSEVAKMATYTHAYAESKGFLTLLSDGETLTGAYALGPEAGEWMQQATLAIRTQVPLDVLRDVIQPFPTFSEIYVAALKELRGQITAARQPAGSTRA
jgi:pyruvate/2-oxoglutarate dehydrogenase complex dihydrolipoamide dehydrogenase (E3) component